MTGIAPALYLTLLAACMAAAVSGALVWLAPRPGSLKRIAEGLGWLTTLLALAAWVARWTAAGHLPLFGTYESALSLAVAVLVAALGTVTLCGRRVELWAVAAPIAAVVLAHGLAFDPTAYALTISERSWVVDVHAVLAWAAFGALTVNAAFAGVRLVRRQGPHQPTGRGLSTSLSAGFLLHSAMLASGSFYKFLLFGEAWTFDPIEILGFIAWISYGTLLHLHLMGGWEGRRLARWCLGLFVLLLISYRGIVYFPAWSTYHIFDMDLRIHVTGSETPSPGGTP